MNFLGTKMKARMKAAGSFRFKSKAHFEGKKIVIFFIEELKKWVI